MSASNLGYRFDLRMQSNQFFTVTVRVHNVYDGNAIIDLEILTFQLHLPLYLICFLAVIAKTEANNHSHISS